MIAPVRCMAAMLSQALAKRRARSRNQRMRANADDPWPDPALFASLGWPVKEIYATIGPIAKTVESGQCSHSAKALLEPIKQSIEAYQVGETAHFVNLCSDNHA